jgi:hypothetical protein
MVSPPTPAIRIDLAPSVLKVAVIGAGPSGLVALKTLLDEPYFAKQSAGKGLHNFFASASGTSGGGIATGAAGSPGRAQNVQIQATVFEKEESVGGTFKYRS